MATTTVGFSARSLSAVTSLMNGNGQQEELELAKREDLSVWYLDILVVFYAPPGC